MSECNKFLLYDFYLEIMFKNSDLKEEKKVAEEKLNREKVFFLNLLKRKL